MKKYLLILIVLFLFPRVKVEASEAGAIFLIIYPGARPNGMGATFTSVADDALATYYNDAGLGFQENTSISLMHANWLPGLYEDMYYEFLSYAHPISSGVVGGHIIYLTTGETVGVDEKGTKIGEWTTWDASVKISYGTKISKSLALGVGAKWIYSFLAPYDIIRKILGDSYRFGGKGNSWAFDVSSLYIPNELIQLGLSLQNIGPDISYLESGISDPLPWTLRFGVTWHVFSSETNKLTISGELTKIVVGIKDDLKEKEFNYIYHDTWKGLGVEYVMAKMFSVRGGYFWDVVGSRVGPTFGGGINLKGLRFDIGIDAPLYDFETENYRFSLSYSF